MKKVRRRATVAELVSDQWGRAFDDYQGDHAVFSRFPPILVRMLRKMGLNGEDILLVVAVMAHRSSYNPSPFITVRTLGYWTGLSKSTVSDRMKRLGKFLSQRDGGPGRPIRYDPTILLERLVEEKAKLFLEGSQGLLGQMFPLSEAPGPVVHRWELTVDGMPQGSSAMALAVQDLYASPDRPRTPADHDRAWAAAQAALARDFSGYEWEERQRQVAAFVLAQYRSGA